MPFDLYTHCNDIFVTKDNITPKNISDTFCRICRSFRMHESMNLKTSVQKSKIHFGIIGKTLLDCDAHIIFIFGLFTSISLVLTLWPQQRSFIGHYKQFSQQLGCAVCQ